MADRRGYEAIVKRWGNTLALRLPRSMVQDLGLQEGDRIALKIEKVAARKPPGGEEDPA